MDARAVAFTVLASAARSGEVRGMTWRETLYAVDLVALDGEVSWQWEDYFRVAAAMQAAAHELEVSGVLGRLLGLALGDRVPEDGSPSVSGPAGQPARSHSWTARTSSCRGPAGIIDWIKTTQGWRRSWPRSSRPALGETSAGHASWSRRAAPDSSPDRAARAVQPRHPGPWWSTSSLGTNRSPPAASSSPTSPRPA